MLPTIRAILQSGGDVGTQFRTQSNPGDIFSLLLLIGGDIVQTALAQLVGVRVPLSKSLRIPLTPVAFSFGWVAYAFASLKDIFGDGTLMPETDVPSQVINCSTGYVRTNHSWILGRVLRDHEKRTPVDRNKVSIRIDIFEGLEKENPAIDLLWWRCWGIILLQQLIAVVPWFLYGDWSKLFVTICGTIGALATGMLPQWINEKWASRHLEEGKEKITALTRGNGHAHVMIFIHEGNVWDVEAMAAASREGQSQTRYISIVLTAWWTLLLVMCSSLKENTWYLVGVGCIGMLQNIYLAGASRKPEAFNFHIEHRFKIIGCKKSKDEIVEPDDSDADDNQNPLETIGGVMGALMELEKRLPGAGASLVNIFFPGKFEYDQGQFPFNRERKFWKFAYKTMKERKVNAKEERSSKSLSGSVNASEKEVQGREQTL